jgi:hypothetical protein
MIKFNLKDLELRLLRKDPYTIGAGNKKEPTKKLHVTINENSGYRHGDLVYQAEADHGITLLIPEKTYKMLTNNKHRDII